jgi:hypothetical protein
MCQRVSRGGRQGVSRGGKGCQEGARGVKTLANVSRGVKSCQGGSRPLPIHPALTLPKQPGPTSVLGDKQEVRRRCGRRAAQVAAAHSPLMCS